MMVGVGVGDPDRLRNRRDRVGFPVDRGHRLDDRLGADVGHVDHEDLGTAVDVVPQAVLRVLERGDPPRRFGAGVQAVDGAVPAPFRFPADERQPLAVRRPGEVADAQLAISDLDRLSASGGHNEQLRRLPGLGTEESDQFPVRRIPRRGVAETPGQPARRAVSDRDRPELSDVAVGAEVGPSHRRDGHAAVGMERRLGHGVDQIKIIRLHGVSL
nr:hypothetical protein [Microlunatus sp. Gsoil 973]